MGAALIALTLAACAPQAERAGLASTPAAPSSASSSGRGFPLGRIATAVAVGAVVKAAWPHLRGALWGAKA